MKSTRCIAFVASIALALCSAPLAVSGKADAATVRSVQQYLSENGYNCGAIDGVMGANTMDAITRFEADHGMEVTGAITDGLLAIVSGTDVEEAENPDSIAEPPYDASSLPPGGHFYSAAEASWIEPLRIEASSTLTGGNYGVQNIMDHDMRTAWVEGVPGNGQGEFVDYFFEPDTAIIGGMIIPGYYQDEYTFWRNSAPVSITVMSQGVEVPVDVSAYSVSYQDGYQGYRFMLSTPLICDPDYGTLRITISDVREGSAYADTCISELHFMGFPDGQTDLDEQIVENVIPYDDEDEALSGLKMIAYLIQRQVMSSLGGNYDKTIPDMSITRDTLPADIKALVMYWYEWYMKSDPRIMRPGGPYNSVKLTDLRDILYELFMDDSDETWQVLKDTWVKQEEDGMGMMYSSADFGGWYGLADPVKVTNDGDTLTMYGYAKKWNSDIQPIVLDKKYTAVFRKGTENLLGGWVFQSLDIGPDFILQADAGHDAESVDSESNKTVDADVRPDGVSHAGMALVSGFFETHTASEVEFTYYDDGLLKTYDTPDVKRTYHYDADHVLTAMDYQYHGGEIQHETFEYEEGKMVRKIVLPTQTHTYEYGADGRIAKMVDEILADAGASVYEYFFTYDENGRIASMRMESPNGGIPDQKSFQYDQEGNIDYVFSNDFETDYMNIYSVDGLAEMRMGEKNKRTFSYVEHDVQDDVREMVEEQQWMILNGDFFMIYS